jgi:hypothetical protein
MNNNRSLYEALTRRNYFPNQKELIGELPPCIDTRQFTPEICEALASLEEAKERKSNGYDLVEYMATRYNNVPRTLSLVHPRAQASLIKHIHDNWDKIKFIEEGPNSKIKPELRLDGRVMVMNYEDHLSQQLRVNDLSFSNKFRVSADIANCFNSIYSHAIPWAAVGLNIAKSNRDKNWYNNLDKFQRNTKRGETQGIPIGPATSSFVVEIILQTIDQKLAEKGFTFERYVDDYTCFCKTNEKAQDFLLLLGQLLAEYKLTLNLNKTYIIELPCPSKDDWILELLGAMPNRFARPVDEEPKFNSAEAITFIDRAIKVNKITPDGSVLKYAIQLLISNLNERAVLDVLSAVINLAWHFPILIPFIAQIVDKTEEESLPSAYYYDQIQEIIIDNAKQRRSDGMSWPLYILKNKGLAPSNTVIDAVINSGDCVSITILASMLDDKHKILEFISGIIKGDNYGKDNYWLLLYQLFLAGDLKEDPYDDKVFTVLKKNKVNFIPGDSITKAEEECTRISTESIFGGELTALLLNHEIKEILKPKVNSIQSPTTFKDSPSNNTNPPPSKKRHHYGKKYCPSCKVKKPFDLELRVTRDAGIYNCKFCAKTIRL